MTPCQGDPWRHHTKCCLCLTCRSAWREMILKFKWRSFMQPVLRKLQILRRQPNLDLCQKSCARVDEIGRYKKNWPTKFVDWFFSFVSHRLKRNFGSVISFVAGSVVQPQPIEIGAISTAKSELLVTSVCQIMNLVQKSHCIYCTFHIRP